MRGRVVTIWEAWQETQEIKKKLLANFVNPTGDGRTAAAIARKYAKENPDKKGVIAVGVVKGCEYDGFKSGGHFFWVEGGKAERFLNLREWLNGEDVTEE